MFLFFIATFLLHSSRTSRFTFEFHFFLLLCCIVSTMYVVRAMRCASFVWSGGSKHKVSLLAKTKNMSALASTYRIVYHTILSFRACPIQLILHDADASYVIEPPTWEPKRCLNPNTGYPVSSVHVLSLSQTFTLFHS